MKHAPVAINGSKHEITHIILHVTTSIIKEIKIGVQAGQQIISHFYHTHTKEKNHTRKRVKEIQNTRQ